MARFTAGFLAFSTIFSAGAALAAPGLGQEVYSPYPRNGVTEIEVRGGRLTGGPLDGESAAVVEMTHGFGDRLTLAVLGELEHHAGEETKLDAVAVEAVTYLGAVPLIGVDVGAYVEYEQRIHNESGVAEGKILLARPFGPIEARINLIATRPLTNRPGEAVTRFGYAGQLAFDAAPRIQLGLQAFGELGQAEGGRQTHYVGPMLGWSLRRRGSPGEFEFQAAYLVPVAAAQHQSDSQVRFGFEYERRF